MNNLHKKVRVYSHFYFHFYFRFSKYGFSLIFKSIFSYVRFLTLRGCFNHLTNIKWENTVNSDLKKQIFQCLWRKKFRAYLFLIIYSFSRCYQCLQRQDLALLMTIIISLIVAAFFLGRASIGMDVPTTTSSTSEMTPPTTSLTTVMTTTVDDDDDDYVERKWEVNYYFLNWFL